MKEFSSITFRAAGSTEWILQERDVVHSLKLFSSLVLPQMRVEERCGVSSVEDGGEVG